MSEFWRGYEIGRRRGAIGVLSEAEAEREAKKEEQKAKEVGWEREHKLRVKRILTEEEREKEAERARVVARDPRTGRFVPLERIREIRSNRVKTR